MQSILSTNSDIDGHFKPYLLLQQTEAGKNAENFQSLFDTS